MSEPSEGNPAPSPPDGEEANFRADFAKVLHDEVDLFTEEGPTDAGAIRGLRGKERRKSNAARLKAAHERAEKANLVGLAFSGGGIRSATFNLGVLQALANRGFLRMFHYLSTVSGGGYIGGWLQAWLHRQRLDDMAEVEPDSETAEATEAEAADSPPAPKPRKISKRQVGFERVQQRLRTNWIRPGSESDQRAEECGEIRKLRQFSNFLTPKMGWFGADIWAVVALYVRNLALNLLMVVSAFSAVMLLIHSLPSLVKWTNREALEGWKIWITAILPLALIFLSFFLGFLSQRFPGMEMKRGRRIPWYTRQNWIIACVILPLYLAAFLASGSLQSWVAHPPGWLSHSLPSWLQWAAWPITATGLFFVALIAIVIVSRYLKLPVGEETDEIRKRNAWKPFFWACGAGFILGLFLFGFEKFFAEWSTTARTVFYAPAILGLMVLSSFLFVGMCGKSLPDIRREWWSRINGLILIFGIAWIAISGVTLYGPLVLQKLSEWEIEGKAISAISLSWVATTIWGVMSAKNMPADPAARSRFNTIVALVAPYVFIGGLFLFLSWGVFEFLAMEFTPNELPVSFSPLEIAVLTSASIHEKFDSSVWLVKSGIGCALTALIAAFLSWRLDINEFSMHMLYRNRLVRCYLGPSNRRHRNHPFTGLGVSDDIEVAEMNPPDSFDGNRLYPIINTTLNLVGGKELAWQKRKGSGFFFTPRYCGFEMGNSGRGSGFCETGKYASDGGRNPVRLGTAMAISGAAAASNMGARSAPATAFLMTIFNVRLGWWIGNPSKEAGQSQSSPRHTLTHLFKEMFGFTSQRGDFVYLSDGGHFENLGIYELVRRRCRFILASDSEEDPEFAFAGLGNAIEKCRTDFGVEITIDVDPIRLRDENGNSSRHCAVGTIDYGDPRYQGILVYIKSSINGNAPEDVIRYAAANPEFPHESTGDQWFDESQFESYRRLGQHIVEELLANVASPKATNLRVAKRRMAEQFFQSLKHLWYPPSPANEAAFTKHANTLTRIFDQLRNNERVRFLSFQIYPAWTQLFWHKTFPRPGSDSDPLASLPEEPETPHRGEAENSSFPLNFEAVRSGFYLCNSMIQLMEEVYLDLNLEQYHGHPDNRGWMNLFRNWSWSNMFRSTWSISVSTYGARFQTFCENHLELTHGILKINEFAWDDVATWESDGDADNGLDRKTGLNGVEIGMIQKRFKNAKETFDGDVRFYAFRIKPDQGWPPPKGEELELNCGFAVIRDSHEILLYRIQDHLRRMGLGRESITRLIDKKLDNRKRALDPREVIRIMPATESPENQRGIAILKMIIESVLAERLVNHAKGRKSQSREDAESSETPGEE